MKTKTAYRPKPEQVIPQPDHPVIAEGIPAQPEPPEAKFDAPTPVEAKEPEPKKDEAAERIKQQLEADRRAQELQRQWAQQQMAQRPKTRDELLAEWRQGGVSEANLEFLQRHPQMIDAWPLTYHCATEATQRGHQPDSDEHREATRQIFHERLAEAEKLMAENPTATQPTPKFFEPPPPPRPQMKSRGAIVSAPVSRELPGDRPEMEMSPRNVKLSAQEVEAAALSGISVQEYARQKIRMMQAKAAGEIP